MCKTMLEASFTIFTSWPGLFLEDQLIYFRLLGYTKMLITSEPVTFAKNYMYSSLMNERLEKKISNAGKPGNNKVTIAGKAVDTLE